MVYKRTAGGETVVVAVNPCDRKVSAKLPHIGKAQPLITTGKAVYKTGSGSDAVELKGISAAVFRIM